MIKRNHPVCKLTKQPLALVLIQIRFSPIAYIEDYIPKIQEKLQQLGFTGMEENPCVEIRITAEGSFPIQKKQWVFTSTDNYENIIIDSHQLTYQTTNYDIFESFLGIFKNIFVSLAESVPNFDSAVLINRLGLRYVDQIIPIDKFDEIDSYINNGYKIVQAPVFGKASKVCVITQAGEVILKDNIKGIIVYRITQGEKGLSLPPDLMVKPPKLRRVIQQNQQIGLIDIDHSYVDNEGKILTLEELEELFYKMHDNTHDIFYAIVSEEGLKKWK